MSIKAMTRVWEHSHQKGSNLLALLALADHADDSGECWPSEDRIAKKIRMSLRQTQRILTLLETKGEIARKVGDGRGNTTHYLILSGYNAAQKSDKLASFIGVNYDNLTPFKNEERVTNFNIKGDILSQKRVTNPTSKKRSISKSATKQTGKTVGGEPSLEPSLEPSSIPTEVASAPPSVVKIPAAKKPPKDQCLKDALALHWQGISPDEATGYTGQLSARVGQVWRRKLKADILSVEQYIKIARSIMPFVEWMNDEYPGIHGKLRNLDSFEEYYREFAALDGKPKPKTKDNSPWGTIDSSDPSTWLDPDDMVVYIPKAGAA